MTKQRTEQKKVSFSRVIKDELKIINSQRAHRGLNEEATRGADCTGIAISGGGIRSASFGLGVLQALDHLKVLRKFDYLSTVSGGGYIGSALTWFNHLNRPQPSKDPQPPKKPQASNPGSIWKFPFPTYKESRWSRVIDYKNDNSELDFIRQHGNYLTPDRRLTTMSLFGVVLRNALFSALIYLGIPVAVFAVVTSCCDPFADASFLEPLARLVRLEGLNPIEAATMAGVVVLLGLAMTFAFGTFRAVSTEKKGYKHRIWFQICTGKVLAFTVGAWAVATTPVVEALITGTERSNLWKIVGIVPFAIGTGGAIYQFFYQRKPAGIVGGVFSSLRIWVTASLLIYGILLLAYMLGTRLPWQAVVGWIVFSLIFGFFINTNLFSIGRMYRDRLMETFLPNPGGVRKNQWYPAKMADVALLAKLNGINEAAQYHLINANVVLTDAKRASYRERGGDNFVMSRCYCGGDAIGWFRSKDFEGGEMTLATAMSISGAAVNPNAGVGGHGVARNRLIAFMLAFFNIRLGFWARNPNKGQPRWGRIGRPNFFFPGVLQGLLGCCLREKKTTYIELTDGGHFDNTGLYELFRRRLNLILLSQAGADPDFEIDDLANALERARVDFGVIVLFEEEESLKNLVPGTATPGGFAERLPLSPKGYAVGRIKYPPLREGDNYEEGLLVIIKTVLTKELPPEIYSYKLTNTRFPNQATADQFFGEEQLEAYRELGFSLCYKMLENSKTVLAVLEPEFSDTAPLVSPVVVSKASAAEAG